MKKRILGILLILALVLSVLPISGAFADPVESRTLVVKAAGDGVALVYEGTDTPYSETATYEASTTEKKLTLKSGFNFETKTEGYALKIECDCTIKVQGTVYVTNSITGATYGCGMYISEAVDTVTFTGTGAAAFYLTNEGNSTGINDCGKKLILDVGTFSTESDWMPLAMATGSTLEINNCAFFALAENGKPAVAYTTAPLVAQIWDDKYEAKGGPDTDPSTFAPLNSNLIDWSGFKCYSYGTDTEEKVASAVKISKNKAEVTIDYNYISPMPPKKAVGWYYVGQTIDEPVVPETPTTGPKVFKGWYKRVGTEPAETDPKWDFDTVVTNDDVTPGIYLYAKYDWCCKGYKDVELSTSEATVDKILSVNGEIVAEGVTFVPEAYGNETVYKIRKGSDADILYLWTKAGRSEANWVKDNNCTWYKDEVGFYYKETKTEYVLEWQSQWPFVKRVEKSVTTKYYLNIDEDDQLWALNVPVVSKAIEEYHADAHTWGTCVDKDENVHVRYCSIDGCGASEEVAHGTGGYDYIANIDGETHAKYCKDCHRLLDTDENHRPNADNTECVDCGAKLSVINLETSTITVTTKYEKVLYFIKRPVYTCTPVLQTVGNYRVASWATSDSVDGTYAATPFVCKNTMKDFYVKANIVKDGTNSGYTYTMRYNQLTEQYIILKIEDYNLPPIPPI